MISGASTPVAWTRLPAPAALMGPADGSAHGAVGKASPLFEKYAAAVDRESAREKLAAKLQAGAAEARAEQEEDAAATTEEKLRREADRAPRGSGTRRRPRAEKSAVEEILTSTTARQLGRTAVREVLRGMFRTPPLTSTSGLLQLTRTMDGPSPEE